VIPDAPPSHWMKAENFPPSFQERIQCMAGFISEGMTVMDLGCGPMRLKTHLPARCIYYGVDYIQRDEHTLLCDFNKGEFPSLHVDCIFCSGILEYIHDVEWFITEVCSHGRRCVLSYNTSDQFPSQTMRESLHWVNQFSVSEVIRFFALHTFDLVHHSLTEEKEDIFVFQEGRKA